MIILLLVYFVVNQLFARYIAIPPRDFIIKICSNILPFLRKNLGKL